MSAGNKKPQSSCRDASSAAIRQIINILTCVSETALFLKQHQSNFRAACSNKPYISGPQCNAGQQKAPKPSLKTPLHSSDRGPQKITESAWISCSGAAANPFLIQSYNLEGLSADLPVQATNGWAKGLHRRAWRAALPLLRWGGDASCAFSLFVNHHHEEEQEKKIQRGSNKTAAERQRAKAPKHSGGVALNFDPRTIARYRRIAERSEGAGVGISLSSPYSFQGYSKSERQRVLYILPPIFICVMKCKVSLDLLSAINHSGPPLLI